MRARERAPAPVGVAGGGWVGGGLVSGWVCVEIDSFPAVFYPQSLAV